MIEVVLASRLAKDYNSRFGAELSVDDTLAEIGDGELPSVWRMRQASVQGERKLSLADRMRLAEAMVGLAVVSAERHSLGMPDAFELAEKQLQAVQDIIAPGSPIMANEGRRRAEMMPPKEMILPHYAREAERLASGRRQLLAAVLRLPDGAKREVGGRIDWIGRSLSQAATLPATRP